MSETDREPAALAIIEESGFEAIGAASADEAIRALESRSDIRAVFTDIQMPGQMDGVKLARVIRDRWPAMAVVVTPGKTRLIETDLPNGGSQMELGSFLSLTWLWALALHRRW